MRSSLFLPCSWQQRLMPPRRRISPNSVRKLLTEIGFSRQVNRKADGGRGRRVRAAGSLRRCLLLGRQ
jgi:hypothetical protein